MFLLVTPRWLRNIRRVRSRVAVQSEKLMEPEKGSPKRLALAAVGEWRTMLVGAFSFWLPDIVYHFASESELSTTAIWTMTAVMPLLALIAYGAVVCTIGRRGEGRWSVATSMLLGIWVLAPTMIGLGQTFAGAGFRSGHASIVIILGTVLFPIYALIMSGYDLTIPALLLVTILLLGVRFTFERRQTGEITVQ
jgi:hypothetical protein